MVNYVKKFKIGHNLSLVVFPKHLRINLISPAYLPVDLFRTFVIALIVSEIPINKVKKTHTIDIGYL